MPRFVLILSMSFIVLTASLVAFGDEPPPGSIGSGIQLDDETEPETDPRDGFDLALSVGAGLSELAHGDLRILLTRFFYVGAGIGGFPADPVIDYVMGASKLQDVEVQGANLSVVSDTSLLAFMGFVRVLPFGKAFFVEGAFEMWRLKAVAWGTLTSPDVPGQSAELSASAKALVPMMGAHGGWCFLSKAGVYFELMFGANFPLEPAIDVQMGQVPTNAGVYSEEVDRILSDASVEIDRTVGEQTKKFIKRHKVIPTAAIRVGFAFNLVGGSG